MKKRLVRNMYNASIGGVCSGLADYTGMSTMSWRLLFILFTFLTTFPGAIVYAILWIAMPSK